jgi:hypothetical protein
LKKIFFKTMLNVFSVQEMAWKLASIIYAKQILPVKNYFYWNWKKITSLNIF